MYKTGNERGNYGCIKSLILIKILALTKVRIIPLERKKKKKPTVILVSNTFSSVTMHKKQSWTWTFAAAFIIKLM